jgi:hypothetical protein
MRLSFSAIFAMMQVNISVFEAYFMKIVLWAAPNFFTGEWVREMNGQTKSGNWWLIASLTFIFAVRLSFK